MHRSLIVLALLIIPTLATAQVYKWKDANGVAHYSETPPNQGTKYNEVKMNSGEVAPVATAEVNNEQGENNSEGGSSEPTAKPVTDTPDNRKKLCSSLKTNLATLQGSGPVVMQQDGKPTALDAGQRKQQLATAQAQYNQYCSSETE